VLIQFTGDLHIGQGSRYGKIASNGLSEKMIEQSAMLDSFVEKAIESKVDMVCFGGDYFPKHFRLDPTAVRFFSEPILKLSRAGITTRMLLGNHDKARHESMDSNIDYFKIFKVAGIEIIGDPKIELVTGADGNKVVMLYLPHLIPSDLYKYQKHEKQGVTEIISSVLDNLLEQAETALAAAGWAQTTPRILAGHFGVSEAGKGSESLMIANNNICFPAAILDRPGINLAIFSHIHKFWMYKDSEHTKIVSIGSMDRFDFGELDEKKYGKIEIIGDKIHLKAIRTNPHPFVSITHDISNDTPLDFLSAYDVENAVVKVSLRAEQGFSNHKAVVEEIKKWLETQNIYLLDSLAIIPKPYFTNHNTNITEEMDLDGNIQQLLSEDHKDMASVLFKKHMELKDLQTED